MDDICDAYRTDNRPWIVGYSGGKDSTALLQIIYYALLRLPVSERHKSIYVLCSDTRVEAPYIQRKIKLELERIEIAARNDGLPITCSMVYPELNDSFWVNLIGRGYPSPNRWFRWCTDRLKIRPVSAYIRERVDDVGDVVVVLGARFQESSTRAQTLNKNRMAGELFRPHPDISQAWIYTPIENLTTEQVWIYLLQVPNPCGSNNRNLVALYRQASQDGECPMVLDTSTPPCGNSRFGCWTCTVIDRDKSMEALVDSGDETLEPLLELRDYLKQIRDDLTKRMGIRRDGREGPGPFTHSTRADILERLLEAQFTSGYHLIGGDELAAIQDIWIKDGLHPYLLRQIWRAIYEEVPVPMSTTEFYAQLSEEEKLLYDVCEHHNVPFKLLSTLLETEEQYASMRRRTGLPDDLRTIVEHYINEAGD